MKGIVFIFIFTFIIYSVSWFATRGEFFRLDTDYDGSLPTYYFLVDHVRSHGSLPSWNPFVGTGIPVLGDPVSTVANPILTGTMIAFGVETGMRLTVGIMFFISALSMWWLLTTLQVSGWLRVWGSLLFATAGNFTAYVGSGHIQEFLTYPAIPIIIGHIVKRKWYLRDSIIFSIILSYVWYSGYTYLLWFTLIFALVSLRSIRTLTFYTFATALFILFTWPKTYHFYHDVLPNMERLFPIEPYKGSIHSILFPLGWIMPLQTAFYDRPFFQRLFGFSYNWYEYYAFITPLPFFFLIGLRRLWKNTTVRALLILFITSALYIALAYPYSPFYWIYQLVPFAKTFRVPSRIYGPATAVIIALLTLCAKQYKKKALVLCVATLLWTSVATYRGLISAFEEPRTFEKNVAMMLRRADSSNFFVATFVCCMQTFLVQEGIPILNFYYAWRPKDTPNFIRDDLQGQDYSMLRLVRPKYVIGPIADDFTSYGYIPFQAYSTTVVWKTAL